MTTHLHHADHLDPTGDDPTDEADVPAYTAVGPARPSVADLRARIPGWGADLDPQDRPSSSRLDHRPDATGAHWRFPERQPERRPRERSTEHRFLTPVFGTAQPMRGLSGRLRKLAYARWSEARMAHWLTLIAADRVDVYESAVGSLVRGRPDNLVAETGVRAEIGNRPLGSRFGEKRSDWRHHLMDPVVVLAPPVLGGLALVAVARRLLRASGGSTT